MNAHTKQISIRVTVEEFEKLDHHCSLTYSSKNQVIRNWIQDLPDIPKPKKQKRAK
jgi:hypothetical protein